MTNISTMTLMKNAQTNMSWCINFADKNISNDTHLYSELLLHITDVYLLFRYSNLNHIELLLARDVEGMGQLLNAHFAFIIWSNEGSATSWQVKLQRHINKILLYVHVVIIQDRSIEQESFSILGNPCFSLKHCHTRTKFSQST